MSSITSLLHQSIHFVPSFTLECGRHLYNVPVAYKSWGRLNDTKDNVMIICHAFTGSADVKDWWGPLMGRNKAFDPSRFFIFCANVLGSPYGSASPLTLNSTTQKPYGPEFPRTTIRDDVRIHKLVLDSLGVTSVAVVIGGSMGGMAVLEWPLCSPSGYIRHVVPMATSARHSAWCISWGEAQRQSIYSDPEYMDGYYDKDNPPVSGLGAARMAALLTYRSRDSFENRFGRNPQVSPSANGEIEEENSGGDEEDLAAHNEGQRRSSRPLTPPTSSSSTTPSVSKRPSPSPIFSAQSYLRYQAAKFTARFDANCYIHITRKMDTHDLARDRIVQMSPEEPSLALAQILSSLPPRALVIGVETDGLFTTTEQRELASYIPNAELVIIHSPDGHDGFLLEFEQINRHLLRFLKSVFPDYYRADVIVEEEGEEEGFEVKNTSLFGEAEVDITRW